MFEWLRLWSSRTPAVDRYAEGMLATVAKQVRLTEFAGMCCGVSERLK